MLLDGAAVVPLEAVHLVLCASLPPMLELIVIGVNILQLRTSVGLGIPSLSTRREDSSILLYS